MEKKNVTFLGVLIAKHVRRDERKAMVLKQGATVAAEVQSELSSDSQNAQASHSEDEFTVS